MPRLATALGLSAGRYGTAAAFTPADLTPLIWLDASQLGLANDDPVAEFTDYSGNSRHFVQTTAGNKPLFKSAGINGIGAVEGDGTDDFMTLAAFGAQATWWGIIVLRTGTVGAGQDWWGIDNYDPDGSYCMLETRSATEVGINHHLGAWSPAGITIADNTDYGFYIKGSATAASLRNDKSGTTSAIAADISRADAPMRLFARGDGLYANIRIGELIFGSGSLSGDDEAALWDYVNTKWGTSFS